MKKIPLTILCTLVALPSLASAESFSEHPTQTVSYHDLDLTSAAGQQSLHRRVDGAIRNVCGNADIRDLSAMRSQRACRVTARSGVLSQMMTAMARANRHVAVGAATAMIDTNR